MSRTPIPTSAELFARNLARLIAARGITLYRLAKDTGTHGEVLREYSRGTKIPPGPVIDRFAAYFSVPVQEFFIDAATA